MGCCCCCFSSSGVSEHQRNNDQFQQANGSGAEVGISELNFAVKKNEELVAGLLQEEVVSQGDESITSISELCILCVTRRRVCALIPCGHAATCFSCVIKFDKCPICRKTFLGLSRRYTGKAKNTAQNHLRCKHCGEFVLPFLFDGHQEVCGLRKMQEKRAAEEEEAKKKDRNEPRKLEGTGEAATQITCSSSSSATIATPVGVQEREAVEEGASDDKKRMTAVERIGSVKDMSCTTEPALVSNELTSVSQNTNILVPSKQDVEPTVELTRFKEGMSTVADGDGDTRCLECGKAVLSLSLHMVVVAPCGHVVLCEKCAVKKNSCPLCMETITKYFILYDY